jgi:hypothetical protein
VFRDKKTQHKQHKHFSIVDKQLNNLKREKLKVLGIKRKGEGGVFVKELMLEGGGFFILFRLLPLSIFLGFYIINT